MHQSCTAYFPGPQQASTQPEGDIIIILNIKNEGFIQLNPFFGKGLNSCILESTETAQNLRSNTYKQYEDMVP